MIFIGAHVAQASLATKRKQNKKLIEDLKEKREASHKQVLVLDRNVEILKDVGLELFQNVEELKTLDVRVLHHRKVPMRR